jgi:hypothetical protein
MIQEAPLESRLFGSIWNEEENLIWTCTGFLSLSVGSKEAALKWVRPLIMEDVEVNATLQNE